MKPQRKVVRNDAARATRLAFTLIEVLLVLAILGVIAAMVVPNLLGRQQEANIKATGTSIQGVENAAETYAVDHDGEWPQSLQQLLQPEVVGARQRQPYLDEVPLDPWGNPIQYEFQSGQLKPHIWSWGPNKTEGGGDDISNMDQQNQQQRQL